MMRKILLCTAGALMLGAASSPAEARPAYLAAFKEHYAGKPMLAKANCTLCHVGMPQQAMWNPYGQAVRRHLGAKMVTDKAKIVAALVAAGKDKRGPRARMTFEQIIQRDQLPGAAPMRNPNANPNRPPAAAAAPGVTGTWTPLFNGRNMDGWTKMHAGNWVVENGVLRYTGGGNGWLRTNNTYENYALVVEWRYLEPGANNDSGIFLKARAGDNRSPWPNSPQLNMGPGDNLASIGGTQGTRPRADLINRTGWNTYQVTVHNGMATLAVNNRVAWDVATSDALSGAGHIGIQAENRPIEFRQIWIMPLR